MLLILLIIILVPGIKADRSHEKQRANVLVLRGEGSPIFAFYNAEEWKLTT